jgi:hypothetical protein
MLTFTELDDYGSFLIHTSLDSYHGNQNLEIGHDAFLDFYPNKFNRTATSSSSSLASSKLEVLIVIIVIVINNDIIF